MFLANGDVFCYNPEDGPELRLHYLKHCVVLLLSAPAIQHIHIL